MLQERLWALPLQSILVLLSHGQKPCPGRVGVQEQFLLSVRCAAATGTSVQLWEDKSKVQHSPGCPQALAVPGLWLSPGSARSKVQ